MLKLCVNPNYKQVLGKLLGHVSTGSTLCHWAHYCAQGFFLGHFKKKKKNRKKAIINCAWEKHTTRVAWCAKFRHRLHDDEKVPYAHVCGGNVIKWWNITNAILYIGLMTWCNKSLHLEKNSQLTQAKESTLCK